MGFIGPVASRSSHFIERWSKAEHANGQLKITLFVLAVVCVVLCSALVHMSFTPKPIYYIPGAWEAGVALPQSAPQTIALAFVSSWVLNWTNFTPATVSDIYVRAQRFMSPHLLAQTQSRLSKDIDEVKHNNISSLFSFTREPVVVKGEAGFLVTLQGDKGIYMGKDEIKIQPTVYRVQVRVVNPTENNPYGLMIDGIEQEATET